MIALVAAAFFATAPCTPDLGADLNDISHAVRRTRNVPEYVTGALVRVVWAGGPAGRAGVRAGDVIQGVAGDLVQNVCDVRRAVEKRGCGNALVTVRRGTDTLVLEVHLDGSRFVRKKTMCAEGDGAACTALARAHDDDLVLLRQACDLGDADGCYRLALKLGNTKEGAAAYEQACDAGNPLACTNLGWMMQNGEGMRVDLAGAFRLYQRGCDGTACGMHNDLGCVNLGRLYRDGIGVKEDAQRAVTLFRDVCERGAGESPHACSLAGTTGLFGKNIEHDVPRSLALLEKGCNGGDAWGCFNLGALYETADGGVQKDIARAAGYYRRACDGGDAEACQRLGALQK